MLTNAFFARMIILEGGKRSKWQEPTIRDPPERELAHSVLLKRMKTDARTFLVLVTTLEQRGDIAIRTQSSSARPGRHYRLAENAGNGDET